MSAADVRDLMLSVLAYDSETGRFTWRRRMNSRAAAGAEAGCVYANGYRHIPVGGKYYLAHRLAWLYVHGEWPRETIDHVNGDPLDNRIANLRDVSLAENMQNRRSVHADKQSCGLLGVTWDESSASWKAQLTHERRTVYLGRHESPEQAHVAYMDGKRQIHSGCTF